PEILALTNEPQQKEQIVLCQEADPLNALLPREGLQISDNQLVLLEGGENHAASPSFFGPGSRGTTFGGSSCDAGFGVVSSRFSHCSEPLSASTSGPRLMTCSAR